MGKLLKTSCLPNFWCLLVLELTIHSAKPTEVTFYRDYFNPRDNNEMKFVFKTADPNTYSLGNFKAGGFKIKSGSCITVFHITGHVEQFTYDFLVFNRAWKHNVTDVAACGAKKVTYSCPEDTFVKRVEYDFSSANHWQNNGLKISCYKASEIKTPSKVFNTNPRATYNTTGKRVICTGVRGLLAKFSNRLQVADSLQVFCDAPTNPNRYTCTGEHNNEAVSGITVMIEIHTKWIKELNIHCSEVKAIEEICRATDLWNNIFSCDAIDANTPFTCEHTKTVGFAKKVSNSSSQANEYNFHTEFSGETGVDTLWLKSKFTATVGFSFTTTYNWESSQESTWSEETSFKIIAVSKVGCMTLIREVLGTCSFLKVRPNQISRKDICPNKTKEFDTIFSLPMPLVNKRSSTIFFVPVPKALMDSENKLRMEHRENGFAVQAKELSDYSVPFDGELGHGLISSSEVIESGPTNLLDVSMNGIVVHDSYGNNRLFRSNSHWATEVVGPLLKKIRPVHIPVPKGSRY